jgi:signal transduction histidine kinase
MAAMPPTEILSGAREALAAKVLSQAFASFQDTAESLERSYQRLESEVARLRRELEERNAELARSLAEKGRMRDALHTILESLPCGVLVAEKTGSISFLNRAGAAIVAAPQPAEHVSQLPSALQLALEMSGKGGEWELELQGAQAKLWLHLRHAPLGPAEESVYILEDVSESKRLAEARQRMERDRALAEMAAVLAHEIRNPLGSLELFAGLLAETSSQSEQRGWAEQVQAGLRMLAATVNNVLHFHHLPCPQLAATDVGELLSGACEFLQPLARRAGVELRLAHELDGVEIRADRHRLEQVLLNLALNSLRAASGPGKTLVFSGRLNRDSCPAWVEVEVLDDGPGLAGDDVERIFQAGFSTRPGSPGLGLTVCKLIVEQHGGSIRAANRPSGGACFAMRFPLGGPA